MESDPDFFDDFSDERVNYASLNSDSSILCMATTAGVRLVRFPDPIPVFYHDCGGSVVLACQLNSSGVVAYVLEEERTVVHFWDENKEEEVSEVQTEADIRAIGAKDDTLVLVTDKSVFMYDVSNGMERKMKDSVDVPDGASSCLIGFGKGCIVTVGKQQRNEGICVWGKKCTLVRNMHPLSNLKCLAVSPDGKYIGAVDMNGQHVQIYRRGDPSVDNYWRGKDVANAYSMAFNCNNTLLALFSSKGTLHVFRFPRAAYWSDTFRWKRSDYGITNLGSDPGFVFFDKREPKILYFLSSKGVLSKFSLGGYNQFTTEKMSDLITGCQYTKEMKDVVDRAEVAFAQKKSEETEEPGFFCRVDSQKDNDEEEEIVTDEDEEEDEHDEPSGFVSGTIF